MNKFFGFTKIDKAIKSYYESAFAPEITNAIEILNKAEFFLELLQTSNVKGETSQKIAKTGFQINLLEIENEFKRALRNLHLKKSFILYIDGTDQIPLDIKRADYIECLRGLANAIWELNQFIFPTFIPDGKVFIKIVLLIRPDIFSVIRFHNANAKLKDNSVILNWVTRESSWRNSRLFKMADNIFASQQDSKFALGFSWATYCEESFDISNGGKLIKQPSFVALLKRTFMRPRDIYSLLDILHNKALETNLPKITSNAFNQSQVKFARYLLGEIKDQFLFFYTEDDWQILIDFFKYFDGRNRFDYRFYLGCYNRFIEDYPNDNPDIFDSPEMLLQSLYNYNIICYIEESSDEEFFKWSYKERSYTNLEPLVDYESEYMFHIGITRAIGIGKAINRRRRL